MLNQHIHKTDMIEMKLSIEKKCEKLVAHR